MLEDEVMFWSRQYRWSLLLKRLRDLWFNNIGIRTEYEVLTFTFGGSIADVMNPEN